MTFKIERNVPPPPGRCKYPFGRMAVGDSFALTLDQSSKVSGAAIKYGISHNRKFSVRKHGDGARCWRIA